MRARGPPGPSARAALDVRGGGDCLTSEPTLYMSDDTLPMTQAWILCQLRGTNKRIHVHIINNLAEDADEPEAGRTQFISELSYYLRAGTFASLHWMSSTPMPQEIIESICVSPSLRTLGLEAWGESDAFAYLEYESLLRALLSSTAAHAIESIPTDIWPRGGTNTRDSDATFRAWDFLDIPSLKHLYLHLYDRGRHLFTQIEALKSRLRRRAQLGLPPLLTRELAHYSFLSLERVVAAVAEALPTIAVKETRGP